MAIGNMHKKLLCSSEDVIADKKTHTDTQTDTLITILDSSIAGRVLLLPALPCYLWPWLGPPLAA